MKGWNAKVRYAIAFDLDVEQLKIHYSSNYNNAYADIKRVFESFGFLNQQGSLYFGQSEEENAVKCMLAVQTISRQFTWFDVCVRDIRMLRIEDNNDLKPVLTSNFKQKE